MGPLLRGLLPTWIGFWADRFRGPRFWGVLSAWTMFAGMGVVALVTGNALVAAGMLLPPVEPVRPEYNDFAI